MTVEDFTATLVRLCLAKGNTDHLDRLEAAALLAVEKLGGTQGAITAASGNGKSVSKSVSLTPAETLDACLKAREILTGAAAPLVVHHDFSGLL